jgi:hypothetical protein
LKARDHALVSSSLFQALSIGVSYGQPPPPYLSSDTRTHAVVAHVEIESKV